MTLKDELALLLVKYKGRFDSMQDLAERIVADMKLEERMKTEEKPADPNDYAGWKFII